MKLSIVIPLYNKEDYIIRCLDSLLAQDVSKSEFEIIIVDDGSTDSSFSIAKEYAEKYPNIQLFKQKNGGPGKARNKGLKIAKGKFIYFLDADDYLVKNVFKNLISVVENNNLEILGFNTKYVNDNSLVNSLTKNTQDLSINVMEGMKFIAERGFRNEAWWYIINKKFLLESGIEFIHDRFMEDSIFTASLLLKTKRISKINYDVHRFVQVENSATTNKKPEHTLKFINDLVYAIEELDVLINNLDSSNIEYEKVVKLYKSKQQSFVFSLIIKSFNCRILSITDLKKILLKLNKLGVYPINSSIGGIGSDKTRFFYYNFVLPIFNTKPLLFLGLKIKRVISSN